VPVFFFLATPDVSTALKESYMQQARGAGNEEETKNAHGGGCFFLETFKIFWRIVFGGYEKTIWDLFFCKTFLTWKFFKKLLLVFLNFTC
jgi:hypothetical protein